jgi:hypothetical protein
MYIYVPHFLPFNIIPGDSRTVRSLIIYPGSITSRAQPDPEPSPTFVADVRRLSPWRSTRTRRVEPPPRPFRQVGAGLVVHIMGK